MCENANLVLPAAKFDGSVYDLQRRVARQSPRGESAFDALLIEWIEWIVAWVGSMSGALLLKDAFFVIE
jgi:hypothetical protein